jgi:hypothetical protein
MKKSEPQPSKGSKQPILLSLAASLTLGLAPFVPEPHLFGKWRWVLGGAKGMQPMDWFDFILHTSPFVFLIYFTLAYFLKKKKAKN